MKKVLLVATVQSHICQFHKPLVEVLREKGDVEIHVAARNNLEEKNGLTLDFADKVFDVNFNRSPFKKQNIEAYKELVEIIEREKYDIIQCNTPVAGVLARLAARKQRKQGVKVLYTAHGFHFYKGAPLLNWLIYYPIEKIMSGYTDFLITINQEDYLRVKNIFKCNVRNIHGVGVDENRYNSKKMHKANETLTVLCIGELLKNKNQEMAIKAISEVKKHIPKISLIIAGNGPEEANLKMLIEKLSLEKNVELIGYRTDLERYQNISDIVISCSYREGLPLNIIEGMLSENPIIATRNRGHNELVRHGKNGFLVNQDDYKDMANKILCLIENRDLAMKMGKTGRQIGLKYSFTSVKKELKGILDEVI